MVNEHLQKIGEALRHEDLTFEIGNSNELIPFPHALINIPSDVNDSEFFLFILSIVEAEVMGEFFESTGESDLLTLLYPFPYQVEGRENIANVTRLLHLINTNTAIGTFGFNEYEQRCFFRYSLILDRKNPDYSLAKSSILLAKDNLSAYFEAIEDVSSGITTTDELLEKFRHQIEENEDDADH